MEGPGPRTWGSGSAAPIHLVEGLTGKHGEFQRKTSQNLNYVVVSIFFSINLLMQSLGGWQVENIKPSAARLRSAATTRAWALTAARADLGGFRVEGSKV